VLSTQTLDDGTATYGTNLLAPGSHVITAVYSGDSTYAGSTSPSVTHVVNPTTCIT
jgi:Bacterial Ig-like domain (group 3)